MRRSERISIPLIAPKPCVALPLSPVSGKAVASNKSLLSEQFRCKVQLCKRGHELTDENSIWRRDRSKRECRICKTDRDRRYRQMVMEDSIRAARWRAQKRRWHRKHRAKWPVVVRVAP